MAAPHVSVAAALVRAAVPGIAPQGVELVLQRTVTPFPSDPSPQRCAVVKCGAGIVDAGAAIARLLQSTPVAGLLTRSTGTPAAGATFTITAHAVDRDGIHFAQYRVGTGTWKSMSAMDGAWGERSEDIRATVTAPTASGSHQVCIRVSDEDGHITTDTICTTVVVDASAPTLTLTRDPAADPTDESSVTVIATWSESVKGFTASDVSAAGGTVSGFGGSGASYHWTVTRNADGAVSSTVRAKAVTDMAGNVSGGAKTTSWLVDRYGPGRRAADGGLLRHLRSARPASRCGSGGRPADAGSGVDLHQHRPSDRRRASVTTTTLVGRQRDPHAIAPVRS